MPTLHDASTMTPQVMSIKLQSRVMCHSIFCKEERTLRQNDSKLAKTIPTVIQKNGERFKHGLHKKQLLHSRNDSLLSSCIGLFDSLLSVQVHADPCRTKFCRLVYAATNTCFYFTVRQS